MKKNITLCASVIFILILSLTSFAKNDIKPLIDIGIFNEDVYEEKYVTLDELCRITANLISPPTDNENKEDDTTDYLDLFKSGGLINNDKTGEMYATGEDVCKLYLYSLGYYDASLSTGKTFTGFARTIGLTGLSGITYEGEVNYRMIAEMTYNLLNKPVADISIGDDGKINTLRSEKGSVLSEVFDISVYEGKINYINKKPYSAEVEITKNVYEDNDFINPGNIVNFKCKNGVDLNSIENAPSVFWVKDGKILSAFLKDNSEISFGVILSVNDNKNEDAKYIPSNISEIMLYDDKKEYKISKDFKVKTDGVISGNFTSVSLIGKYARIVKTDNKISFVETWSFSDGGLITKIENTTTETIIHYTDKTNTTARFKKLKDYENIKVIINGRFSDVASIKKDSVFSWFAYDDTLVIAINEKVISERFNAVSEEYAQIGRISYLKNDVIYFSKDFKIFSGDKSKLNTMLSNDVSAYFDITNKVLYITPAKNSSFSVSSFLGLVTGYIYDDFSEKREIEILSLEGDLTKKAYNIRKKAVLSDGITYDDINTAANLDDSSAIYEFLLNSDDEIIEIKNACRYNGIGSYSINLGNFNNNSSIASLTSSDGSDMYIHDTPIVVVYKDIKGRYIAKKEAWINMYDKNADGCKAYVFGYETSSDPKLIVISGKTENISSFNEQNGIITKKSIVIDENGEQKYKLTVLTAINEQDYYIPIEEGMNLPERAYITFKNNFRYDFKRTLKITSVSDISSSFDSWQLNGFNFATVKLKGEYTFLTDTDKTCFLHPYYCFVAIYENGEIKKGDMSDINPGDGIYYYYSGGSVRMIFTEK